MSSVPDVLRQKCEQVDETVRDFSSIIPSSSSAWIGYEDGKFLFWKGRETKYLWVKDGAGKLKIYRYHNGPQHAQIHLEHDFGKTAIINDVIYFPISTTCHGVVAAVYDRSVSKHPSYLAYFSLRSRRLLTSIYVTYPVTKVHGIIDGTAKSEVFQTLAEPFHTGWPHILVVGCHFGQSYLVHLGITDENMNDATTNHAQNSVAKEPLKAKKTIPLSKMFIENEMFIFRTDEGTTKCVEKDKVTVTALTYVEKSKLVIMGFNFGGILSVSLKTSKVVSHLYIEGEVNHFALQEPEEDPRPILFLWTSIQVPRTGCIVVLLSLNYPKDEAATKNPSEYTYDEPVFCPSLKWNPDNCSHMISMRTLVFNKEKNDDSKDYGKCSALSDSRLSQNSATLHTVDTSLMLMTWLENRTSLLHGSLFDLNAFYAKRLIGRVSSDSTIARQMPFLSRFSSTEPFGSSARRVLDVAVEYVRRFAAPAFLKDSIDQLYYPSTFHMTMNCLSGKKLMQLKVLPIQVQLIVNISNNIISYFDQPTEPCKWICAIGLANSAPGQNTNEERACLLRVLMHNYFPGVLKMIEHCAGNPEMLRFIQKWVWKEVELTKTKFDDLCTPLFDMNSAELSPSSQGFVHHARVFFKRASLVLESISTKVEALENQEWLNTVTVQLHATRQVKMYSYGVAFGLTYGLLPNNDTNLLLFNKAASEYSLRLKKIQKLRKEVKIHQIVSDAMALEKENMVWGGQTAREWYPTSDFTSFLPVLLLMNVPELTKLTILGYYCLDIENVANASSMQENIFAKACCFFMQEEYSLDVMNEIRMIWNDDKHAAEVNQNALQTKDGSHKNETLNEESELRWLPLCTPEEIEYAKSAYLKLEHGIHKFNWNAIMKKRYNLIIEAPLPVGPEPSFVVECRAKCAEICEKYPWLFQKVESLPDFVLNKYKEKLAKEAEAQTVFIGVGPKYQDQAKIQLNVRHMDDVSKRRRPGSDDEMKFNANETMEELPLSIATPAKQRRLMLFPVTPVSSSMDSTTKAATEVKSDGNRNKVCSSLSEYKDRSSIFNRESVKAKDWDRVNKVIQTPISLTKRVSRIPVRQTEAKISRTLFPLQRPGDVDISNSSPPANASTKHFQTPASILKQSENKSRLTGSAKPRLRFAVESQVEDIPSRADKLLEDLNNTSFSNFAVLSNDSSSSTPQNQGLEHKNESPRPDETPVTSRTEHSYHHVPNVLSTSYEEQDENDVQEEIEPIKAETAARETVIEEQDRNEEVITQENHLKQPKVKPAVRKSIIEEQDTNDRVIAREAERKQTRVKPTARLAVMEEQDKGDVLIAEEAERKRTRVKPAVRHSVMEEQDTSDVAEEDDQEAASASDTAREWVESHLRRSTRMRSPRKIFDERKEFKKKS